MFFRKRAFILSKNRYWEIGKTSFATLQLYRAVQTKTLKEMIHGSFGALLFVSKLKRKIGVNQRLNFSSPTQSVKKQGLVFTFQEISWDMDKVKKSLLINANTKSKREAESLLLDQYVNGFDATNGTFLIRTDINEEIKNIDVILSLVYDGKLLHEKIKMMKYFNRYSFYFENGGIIFQSISALIKYHNLNVAIPLPCLLKDT